MTIVRSLDAKLNLAIAKSLSTRRNVLKLENWPYSDDELEGIFAGLLTLIDNYQPDWDNTNLQSGLKKKLSLWLYIFPNPLVEFAKNNPDVDVTVNFEGNIAGPAGLEEQLTPHHAKFIMGKLKPLLAGSIWDVQCVIRYSTDISWVEIYTVLNSDWIKLPEFAA